MAIVIANIDYIPHKDSKLSISTVKQTCEIYKPSGLTSASTTPRVSLALKHHVPKHVAHHIGLAREDEVPKQQMIQYYRARLDFLVG